MKNTHRHRKQLENSIIRKQVLLEKGKEEIASKTCELSKETRYEIEKELTE